MSESKYDAQIESLRNLANKQQDLETDYVTKKTRANMFFDDDAKIDYLASLRFPDDPLASYRYQFKDGELVHMVERHHIEGREADLISENLTQAYNEFC